jgi:hypothetical protein
MAVATMAMPMPIKKAKDINITTSLDMGEAEDGSEKLDGIGAVEGGSERPDRIVLDGGSELRGRI